MTDDSMVGDVAAERVAQELSPLAAKLVQTLDADELMNCMRCGFCQSACPTFGETGLEAASPRGRIALMKAVTDGLMEPDTAFRDQMDLCLECRACEPACPSDVKYGRLIGQTREVLAEYKDEDRLHRTIQKFVFDGLFPHPRRLRLVGTGLRIYQQLGLSWLARRSGLLRLLPQNVQEMEAIVPKASGAGVINMCKKIGLPVRQAVFHGHSALVIPSIGKTIARVGLFRGCVMDVLFTRTNLNTVRVLRQAGFEIVIPKDQTCCGALHGHAGRTTFARQLALQNISAFLAADVDYIASNAGGCGAFLKEYDELFRGTNSGAANAQGDLGDTLGIDPEEIGTVDQIKGANWFSMRVKDISELLVDYGRPLSMVKKEDRAVVATYQDSCHLRNVMRIRDQPRALLRALPGIEFVELPTADHCCGSAGIYNLTQPEMSSQIIDHKMLDVDTTNAKVIVTTNPGCLLQMKWGLHRHEMNEESAVHLIDLLADHVEFDDR